MLQPNLLLKKHICDIRFKLTAALPRIIKGDISQKLHCICQNPDAFHNSKEFYSEGLFVSEIYQLQTTKPLTSFFHINVKIENGKNNNYFENNKFQMLVYVTYSPKPNQKDLSGKTYFFRKL